MHDWQELVGRRLAGLELDAAEKEEIHAELASHLEETYEASLREGMLEPQALSHALSVVGNWQDLRRKLQIALRKESNMTNRVRQLWLPGLLTLFTSMCLLMLIQFFGPRPQILHPTDAYNLSLHLRGWSMIAPVMVIYVPWLLTLFFIGGLGAYLSHRVGASQRVVFLSVLFPVLPYFCFCLIGFPMALILEEHFAHSISASAILFGFFAWVLLPGIALLAGGLPAQLFLSRRLTSRSTVSD
jgi:DNA-binding transcriptional ArsR family regulator